MKIEMRTINLVVKRLLDLIGSGLGLVLVFPILLISALLIKITMPGPVVFRQERIGKDNRLFYILKFRTMKVDKDAERNHDISKDQERKTVMGNFLRRTKIDELPQLINVFKGDMSLVGPRPTFAEQAAAYTAFQKQRLRMRPGMTGLAQVNGNTAKYDVKYVRDFNVLLDIEILFKTIQVVIDGEEKFAKTMDNKVYGGMEK